MYKKLKFKIQTKILIQKKLFQPQCVLLCWTNYSSFLPWQQSHFWKTH